MFFRSFARRHGVSEARQRWTGGGMRGFTRGLIMALVMVAGCARQGRESPASIDSFYQGIISENHSLVRASLYAKDDALVSAQTRRMIANTRLVHILGYRIQDVDWGGLAESFHIFLPHDFAFAVTGDWEIQGNRATKRPEFRMGGASQPPPPPLIYIRGRWKIDLTPPGAADKSAELAAAIVQYAKVLERTTADLKSAKLNTVEQVIDALERAPVLVSMGHEPPLVLALPAARAPRPQITGSIHPTRGSATAPRSGWLDCP